MMKRILGRYRDSIFMSDIVSALMVEVDDEGDEEHADDLPDDFVKISTGKKNRLQLVLKTAPQILYMQLPRLSLQGNSRCWSDLILIPMW